MTLNTSDKDAVVNELTAANVRGTNAANLQWGAPNVGDVSKIELVIDQYRSYDELIPTMVQAQIRPDLIASKGRQAAIKMRETINGHIRSTVLATTDTDALLPEITTTAGNFGNDAFKTALAKTFADAAQEMDEAYIPGNGRLAIVSPAVYRQFTDWLIEQKLYLVQGANDQAAIMGSVPMYRGFRIRPDNSAGKGVSATDDDKHALFFVRRADGMSYAGQTMNTRSFQSEVYQGWRIQGLFSWGAVLNQPDKVRIAKTVINP